MKNLEAVTAEVICDIPKSISDKNQECGFV